MDWIKALASQLKVASKVRDCNNTSQVVIKSLINRNIKTLHIHKEKTTSDIRLSFVYLLIMITIFREEEEQLGSVFIVATMTFHCYPTIYIFGILISVNIQSATNAAQHHWRCNLNKISKLTLCYYCEICDARVDNTRRLWFQKILNNCISA